MRVTAGARIRSQAALVAEDLVFDDIVVDERLVSTGAMAVDAAARTTLYDLVDRLLVKVADVALNQSLPVLPATVITIPPSLGTYGLPVGTRLGGSPSLVIGTNHVFLDGTISW